MNHEKPTQHDSNLGSTWFNLVQLRFRSLSIPSHAATCGVGLFRLQSYELLISHPCSAQMATDPIVDLAQRLSRELSQESEKLRKERERLEKALDEERRGLKEELRQREQNIREERDGLGYDQERVDIITGRNQIDDDVLSLNVGGEFFFT